MYINLHGDLPAIQIKYHARAKHLKLKIQHQSIELVSPPYVDEKTILSFLHAQQAWLLEKWQPIQPVQSLNLFNNHTQQQQIIPIKMLENCKYLYQYQQDCLIVDKARRDLAIKTFIQRYAKIHLPPYLMQIAHEMGIKVNKISIRHAKTRWGSCNQRQDIMLNAYLVCCPQALIRYVCIHELAHIVHFNHSPQFWAFVEQFDSDYKQHQQALKQIQISF